MNKNGDLRRSVEPSKKRMEIQPYRLYNQSCLAMPHCVDGSIALTVTSPPYWNSIDYDIHAVQGQAAWHREREYQSFGKAFTDYLDNIKTVFREVLRATMEGGFCAIVVGTILYRGKHYPAPMMITEILVNKIGWEFHQDIIWNKVTGGIRRAGSFIQRPRAGYYYPNIMTEYILVFRKAGPMRRGSEAVLDIDEVFKRDIANNIWHIAPIPPRTIAHPCPYPEELVRRLVLLYSQVGDEVLDPFLGSGQTALCALRNERKCVGYEIEPSYLELARKRIQTIHTIHEEPRRKYHLLPRMEKTRAIFS